MKLLVEANCFKCGEPVEREKYFVDKIKFTCEKCKRTRREEYGRKRYQMMYQLFKQSHV